MDYREVDTASEAAGRTAGRRRNTAALDARFGRSHGKLTAHDRRVR